MSNEWDATLAALAHGVVSEFLLKQRWFGAKSRTISGVNWLDWTEVAGAQTVLAWASVRYSDGAAETYFVPLAKAFGPAAENVRVRFPKAIVLDEADCVLYDGLFDDTVCNALLACVHSGGRLATRKGAAVTGAASGPAVNDEQLTVKRGTAEQSNSSIIYGNRWIMKMFRRPAAGKNPDCEICRYLTERTSFRQIPPFAGSLEHDGATLGMLQGLVRNEGDGWEWNLRQLQGTEQNLNASAAAAAILGRRTAEMHLALGTANDDPDFAAEPLGQDAIRAMAKGMEETVRRAFAGLAKAPAGNEELVQRVLALTPRIADFLRRLEDSATGAQRIRIHGDYHLGQVLRVENDFVLLDFEGEPTKPLAERRAKYSPLKDVAGMLRSFSYAAESSKAPWARTWESRVGTEFLSAYRETVTAGGGSFLPENEAGFGALLNAYLLDKAAYELLYEMENRPSWIGIPLKGMLALEF